MNVRQQLKQWQIDSYTIADRFYEQKCQEFNQFIEDNAKDQRQDIEQLQKRIDHFLEIEYGNQQDFDLLKSTIHQLNEKLDRMEQTPFHIVISPLVIDDNLIRIRP